MQWGRGPQLARGALTMAAVAVHWRGRDMGLAEGERLGSTGPGRKQGRERGAETQRAGRRGGVRREGPEPAQGKARRWEGHPLNPRHGISIKLLILLELKLQRTVNYTWKIVWAGPLADGKTVVANEISRLPRGTSSCAFAPWCLRSLHGVETPDHHQEVFSTVNKTTIKNNKKPQKRETKNFPFADLRDKFPFPRN